MLIAVTGGTGYLGAHTVRALLNEGHAVRLLVAPGCADEPVIAALTGLGDLHTLDGDIRDAAVIDRLLDGCDAVLHAAGIVGTDERQAESMWQINAYATESVLTRAVAAGLDPVISVSSYSALFPPPDGVIGPDTPTVDGHSAYGRTKGYADRVARRLQADGAPVVVTYPSSVVGPAFHTAPGITERGWELIAWHRIAPVVRGGMQMVDVRDVAAVHAALLAGGLGPRRYVCGGVMVSFAAMIDAVEAGIGGRIRRFPVSPRLFRGIGRIGDALGRFITMPGGFSHEAALLLTSATPTDDSRTVADLGIRWRSPTEAITESVRASTRASSTTA